MIVFFHVKSKSFSGAIIVPWFVLQNKNKKIVSYSVKVLLWSFTKKMSTNNIILNRGMEVTYTYDNYVK
jgi:hypothetical protein